MSENDLTVEERIEIAADSVEFTEYERKVFVEFCKIWNSEDGEMFYSGYANEWAHRFKTCSELVYADNIRTEYIYRARAILNQV